MADQNPSDSPSLPPIPTIPFQAPSPDQPAPSTPSEIAAASLSSSIESDLPISEVVTALKSASQTPAPILTEVKIESPVTPAPSTVNPPLAETPAPTPSAATTPQPPTAPAAPVTGSPVAPAASTPATPKGPLYEDPDLVKVPGGA